MVCQTSPSAPKPKGIRLYFDDGGYKDYTADEVSHSSCGCELDIIHEGYYSDMDSDYIFNNNIWNEFLRKLNMEK